MLGALCRRNDVGCGPERRRPGNAYRSAIECAAARLSLSVGNRHACRRNDDGAIEQDVRRSMLSGRSEEHTSELQSLMPISYAVICLKTKNRALHTHVPNNISNTESTHIIHN